MIKIATWNVNSVKPRLAHLLDWLKEAAPDIVLLQETKTIDAQFPLDPILDAGYNAAVHGQKTYNGVAILARRPIDVELTRLPGDDDDDQARYIEGVIGNVRVASIYLPNGNPVASDKYEYKLAWMERLYRHACTLLATEDARLVPKGFVFMASRSNSPKERSNQVWMHTWFSIFQTVDALFRNVQVNGGPDPRVDVKDMGFATTDDTVPAFFPMKHNVAGSFHRMASWEEAQLIIAEAQLGQEAVDRINAVRQIHGIADFVPVDVNDATEILNKVVDERAREFFMEGRLLPDMVRFRGDARIDNVLLRFQEGLEPRQVNIYRENYCIPLSDREIDNNPNVEPA